MAKQTFSKHVLRVNNETSLNIVINISYFFFIPYLSSFLCVASSPRAIQITHGLVCIFRPIRTLFGLLLALRARSHWKMRLLFYSSSSFFFDFFCHFRGFEFLILHGLVLCISTFVCVHTTLKN